MSGVSIVDVYIVHGVLRMLYAVLAIFYSEMFSQNIAAVTLGIFAHVDSRGRSHATSNVYMVRGPMLDVTCDTVVVLLAIGVPYSARCHPEYASHCAMERARPIG